MSLILDALRKSEDERRRGQAPDLFAPMPLPATRMRSPRIWPWALAGLSILGMAGLWVWRWPSVSTAKAIDTTEQLPSIAPAAPRASHIGIDRPTPPATTPSPPPTTHVELSTALAPPVVVAAAPIDPPTIATALAVSSSRPAEAAAENVSGSSSESLPSIATLSSTERTALPPLKLSMHVWDGEPGKRFAIIDGQRVTEGSSLSGMVVVAQISREGVVLDISGRHVLLPRP